MKKWRVEGVDAESGFEVRTVIEATTKAIAIVQAKRKGIEVGEIIDVEQEQIDEVAEELDGRTAKDSPTARPVPIPIARGQVICSNPNCGQRVRPKKKARANAFLAIILLLFLLVPGIIYVLLRSGYQYFCPVCGAQIGSDA